ncbi:hypothetical protein HK405_003846 [Cladochytrium tenue]|nr:hypothetical protein HK405_003846 [Cladochytrium tenue]
MVATVVNVTAQAGSAPDMMRPAKLYVMTQDFPFIELVTLGFTPAANGTKAQIGVTSAATEVDVKDISVNNSFVVRIRKLGACGYLGAQLGNDGTMTYGSSYLVFGSTLSFTALPSRPAGYWGKSIAAKGPNSFCTFYTLPLWSGLLPFYANASTTPTVQLASALSGRSMDKYLQTIPVTRNGVIALIDGRSGMMLGASTPNISESWPTQYPAIGNANGLVSAAATEFARRFSTLDPDVNGTVAIAAINNRAPADLQFKYGLDTIYCSTAWIANDTTDLALLLMLMVPSSDFLGDVNVAVRNTIIFVALFCSFSLALGVLLSWALVRPLRRLIVSIQQATKFDFSSLQERSTEAHSLLTEIGTLETAFFAMLRKFAEAITRNKSLMGGGGGTTTNARAGGGGSATS